MRQHNQNTLVECDNCGGVTDDFRTVTLATGEVLCEQCAYEQRLAADWLAADLADAEQRGMVTR
jgi:hypothetical protein